MKTILISVCLLALGAATLLMSSSVIFDWFGIRAKQGNYVPLVVWANWMCGILYIAASAGVLNKKIWAKWLLVAALGILITVSIYLIYHITSGGLYQEKTIAAMAFRTVSTVVLLLLTRKIIKE